MIEVGEEADTQILSTPKKKAFGTRKKIARKNPKMIPLKKQQFQRKHARMTTEGENEDED